MLCNYFLKVPMLGASLKLDEDAVFIEVYMKVAPIRLVL